MEDKQKIDENLWSKNKAFVLVVLIVVIGTVAWYAHDAQQKTLDDLSNAQTTGIDCGFLFFYLNKNGFCNSGESYAQALYRHLSKGYTSSSQCDQYGEGLKLRYHQLEAELGAMSPILNGYVYLPKKQRCIGLTYELALGVNKNEVKGETGEIVDVATLYKNQTTTGYIARCVADYTTETDNCADTFGNSYTTGAIFEGQSTPDSGSSRSVYAELENLAQQ